MTNKNYVKSIILKLNPVRWINLRPDRPGIRIGPGRKKKKERKNLV